MRDNQTNDTIRPLGIIRAKRFKHRVVAKKCYVAYVKQFIAWMVELLNFKA